MSSRKEIKYLLLAIVIIIVGIILFELTIYPMKKDKSELELIVDNYSIVENKTNNKTIKDFPIISEKKDTLSLCSLLTPPKLIYRFSELHCNSCIYKEFENLRKHIASGKLKKDDIIIICYYQNYRNLNIFKRINKLQDFKIYNLINNNIDSLEVEKIEQPYFFTLNNKLKISNTFIPIKAYNQRTVDYLNKIIKRKN